MFICQPVAAILPLSHAPAWHLLQRSLERRGCYAASDHPLTLMLVSVVAAAQEGVEVLNVSRRVDGVGSGLDADTLRGMMPEPRKTVASEDASTLGGLTAQEIVAQSIGAAIAYVNASVYRRDATHSIDPGLCDCVEIASDDSNDFRVNCGGPFLPFCGTQARLAGVGRHR